VATLQPRLVRAGVAGAVAVRMLMPARTKVRIASYRYCHYYGYRTDCYRMVCGRAGYCVRRFGDHESSGRHTS